MKKEKIYNIIICFLCFLLLLVPTYPTNGSYEFSIRGFYRGIKTSELFSFYLIEFLVMIFAIIAIVALMTHIRISKLSSLIISSSSTFIYIIIWIICIFVEFPSRIPIYKVLNYKSNEIWLILFFVLFSAMLTLTALQYLPYLPSRRPTKTARMQAQIDELQKQVDELKGKDS